LSLLEALAAEIDYNYALDGLALFVNQELGQKFYLPFPVKERVVVDQTFATRDLVYALNRSSRYWVLVLSEQTTRLYEGWRDTLLEVARGDFPMAYEGPGATEPMPGGRGVNKSAYRDERHRQFFRQVDAAFEQIAKADPLPLVVAGVDRYLAFFNEVSSNTHLIAATLRGNHDKTPAHELARLVWPLMQEHLARQRREVLQELDAAVSAGKYASGIDAAWRLAQEGRGAVLVVEENFHYPARLDVSGLRLTPVSELAGPEVFDDAVDELIETVLGKSGKVVFVEDGALAGHQRLAMILRY
jgi:ribosomal protein L30E